MRNRSVRWSVVTAWLLILPLASCLDDNSLIRFLMLVGGGSHTCAVLEDDTVKCWGFNGSGQLGLGSTSNRGDDSDDMGDNLPRVPLGTGRTAAVVAAGGSHSCALLDNATVKCWGENEFGQLGLGNVNDRGDVAGEMGDSLPAIELGMGRTAVAIAAGNNHSCALLDDDSVKCWGLNDSGQLGQDATDERGDEVDEMGDFLPAIDLGAGAVAIAAGGDHTCALLDDDTVKCWGENGSGQLGQGDTTDRGIVGGDMAALAAIPLPLPAVAIAAGGQHACAVLNNNTVRCWGENGSGQLGQGTTDDRGDAAGEVAALAAIALGTNRTALAITAGLDDTCAGLDNFTVKCWGGNGFGQLGLGNTANRGDELNEMGDNLPAIALGTDRTVGFLSSGASHNCVILDDGTGKCWGQNIFGQLGQGDTFNRGDGGGEMGDNLFPIIAGSL
jgi:alpha-tubulin suppressor-like RCC1 family protein